jgi:hypothetical protein
MITLIIPLNNFLTYPDNNGFYNINLLSCDENNKLIPIFITNENGVIEIIASDQFGNDIYIDAVSQVSIQCSTFEEAHVVYAKLVADVQKLNDSINNANG